MSGTPAPSTKEEQLKEQYEKSFVSYSDHLKAEKAKNIFLGGAVGSGGSLLLLLVDAISYSEIQPGSIIMIGFMSFSLFIMAIVASHKKQKVI